jgi:hypothetical protein
MKCTSMKQNAATTWLTLVSFLVAVASATAQPVDHTKLESELRAALQARWAALARNDAAAYGAFLDEDVLIPDNGLLYDKKALVDRAHRLKESSSDPREVQVRGDDHAAVMIYRTTSHVPFAGVELSEELRVLETYVKRNGRWLLTARAESEIPNANRIAAEIDSGLLDDYAGDYEIRPNKIVRITRQGNRLMEQGPDDASAVEDLPLSPDSFFQREQPGVVRFAKGPDGKANAYVLWLYDTTVVGRKIR